ncbi:MAG: hypothetical protein MJ240_08460 [Kiritimatiellae bacterium]|nr:hypothetical protein [Kiritimatiellia bacterium]
MRQICPLIFGVTLLATPVGVAESLVVGPEGASVTGVTAEYERMTLHGDYTIGTWAAITNLSSSSGARVDIGPDVGDDATLTVTDGGQFVGAGEAQSSKDALVIGQNGGRGKIVVSEVENPPARRNRPGWNYNNYTFGAMQWCVLLAPGASTTSDTMDILQINPNAFFSVWVVSNQNTRVKARLLFNGGTYYMHHRTSSPRFAAVKGSEILLEGINGNPVKIHRMSGGLASFSGYSNATGTGKVRFCGDCDVLIEGSGDINPGVRLTSECYFEQQGDLILAGNLYLTGDGSNLLPYGSQTGSVVLRDANTVLDMGGRNHQVNALLGSGSVSNGSSSACAKLTISNAADRAVSAWLSPALKWPDSKMGIECIKVGNGAVVADALPAVPKLTVAMGGIRVVDGATVETMKGQSLEFRPGTALEIAGGTYTATHTELHPGAAVTIANGAAYRVQTGDAALVAPAVAAGGTIEKAGPGTLTLYDSSTPYPGVLRALEGTIRLSARGDTNDYWRLTIMQSSGRDAAAEQYVKQLEDICLYSATDTNKLVSTAFKEAAPGTAAADLLEGQVTIPANVVWTKTNSAQADTDGLKYLFDGARWSGFNFTSVEAKLEDPSTWLPITFRYKKGHDPVDAFRMIIGWTSPNWNPQAWRLESSPDGISWATRAERLGGEVLAYDSVGCVCYDYVTGYACAGSAGLAATAVLRADAGATIDLSCVAEGLAPCGGLEVDCARGGGTITRFEPVADGVLRLNNYLGNATGFEVPLTFHAVVNAENLKTWKLFVNGVEKSNRISLQAGKLVVQPRGLIVNMR